MSALGWQDIVVGLIAVAAVGYLVWRKVRARRCATGCGACAGCAVSPLNRASNPGDHPPV